MSDDGKQTSFAEKVKGIQINRLTTNKRVKKVKTIKDTFSFTVEDHALIESIMTKLLGNGVKVNKSEIIRAGLHALNELHCKDLSSCLEGVERVQVGRPKGNI